VSYRPDNLQASHLVPGANVVLRPEPRNQHDPNAIMVWDPTSDAQLGYVPADLSPRLIGRAGSIGAVGEVLGGIILTEYRRSSETGPRVGLKVLIGPAGGVNLLVSSDDDPDPDALEAKLRAASEATSPGLSRMTASSSIAVQCPACGAGQQAEPGVDGFRCTSCQRSAWLISCRRCRGVSTIYGSAAGSGVVEFRCDHCHRKNTVAAQTLRSIAAEVKRRERVAKAARSEAVAHDKEAKREYLEERQEEAEQDNEELRDRLETLETVLSSRVGDPHAFSFADLKIQPSRPKFEPGALAEPTPPPALETFQPERPRGLAALLPRSKRKAAEEQNEAVAAFEAAQKAHEEAESKRQASLEAARADYERRLKTADEAALAQHAAVDALADRVRGGDAQAISEYFAAVLTAMPLPYEPDRATRVAFSSQSRQLVVELALPDGDIVPDVNEYRYVKTRDEIVGTAMPATRRKAMYTGLIAQLALTVVNEVFRAAGADVVETVVMNGHVDAVDKRTGQPIRPCLVTVRATTDQFTSIDLAKVDPIACLKALSASISRGPTELVPVRPVVDFDMADPRFVQEEQILDALDARPNLMELTPSEFESLITNLFEHMGLETRLTQPSRDGGVDCVAYDTRPIFGGKVVIQAKRYKNTVGVSAVRDLFGTMQNEGATKGILVTTSGYGQASHEFANGKPLELIDGGNLLYLLKEHAGMDAKIDVPDDWVDPAEPV
jgi:restriction system protein